jgi:CDP-diacylglycerol--glycerol-3-phosphate 3-phosphatidyltransferase
MWDSRSDLLFWSCVTAGLICMHPDLLATTWPIVAILGAMELTTHAISFWRFGREASPHHILSKLFALALWALLTQMFLVGKAAWLQWPVFAMGDASQAEAMAIMLLLPSWRADVRNVGEARRLRQGALQQ